MNRETMLDDLCVALHDFGKAYAESEGRFIAAMIDEDELDAETDKLVDELSEGIVEYFEEAYGEDGFTTCKCGQDIELFGEPRTCPSCGRLVYPDGY